ncbi:hypothetical protein V8J82_06570 [Gymnodinialimonas sp. 2305UL16-5]|uniref:hypothetical protein n=1 Tax=Gymnodinialimonas mytili TaxID=3126503 RepID=UPI00309F44F0
MIAFSLAAALAAIWLAVHLILGGREIARPLMTSTLDPLVRDVQFMCWHFTSAGIGAMALFFALAAATGMDAYGISGTILAAAFWVIGVVMAPALGQSYAKMPQGWLFLPVAGLGLWGLLG